MKKMSRIWNESSNGGKYNQGFFISRNEEAAEEGRMPFAFAFPFFASSTLLLTTEL